MTFLPELGDHFKPRPWDLNPVTSETDSETEPLTTRLSHWLKAIKKNNSQKDVWGTTPRA